MRYQQSSNSDDKKGTVSQYIPDRVVLLALAWLFIWFLPWQTWLPESIWLRTSITLVTFFFPGILIIRLCWDDISSNPSLLSYGFVISHTILALLGTFSRLAHFPFSLVKHSFMFLGLTLLLSFPVIKKIQNKSSKIFFSLGRPKSEAWLWLLITALAILMSLQRIITEDDLSYLALLTKFRFATPLDFKDIFFGSSKLIAPRFWFVNAPFSQAFLSDMSGLHGIFWIGGLYEPFLVAVSLMSMYSLTRYLGFSFRAATASVMLHVVFLTLLSKDFSPGAPFFTQLSTDKATASYIIFPIFIQTTFMVLDNPTYKNLFLCLLVGISLSLMHAVTLAFTLIILFFLIVFRLRLSKIKQFLPISFIALLLLIPQILVRFSNPDTQGSIAYEIENVQAARGNDNLFLMLGNTGLYTFNPSTLELDIPLSTFTNFPEKIITGGWIILPALSVFFAIKTLRDNKIGQLIFACSLIIAISGIPYTAWLLGEIVSPRMLPRTTWLFPYGLAMVFLLQNLRENTFLGRKADNWVESLKGKINLEPIDIYLLLLSLFSVAIMILHMHDKGLPNMDRFQANIARYEEYARIGHYLNDRTMDKTIMIGTEDLNDLIPGIAGKSYVINFRPSNITYSYFYTTQERELRYHDQQLILERTTQSEDRLRLIKKYDIQFILLKGGEYFLVKKIIEENPLKFNLIKIDRYLILEVIDTET